MKKDKLTETLVQALKRAIRSPQEQRLFKAGKLDGLFPSRLGSSGEAAALALREEHLEVTRTEERGKHSFDWARITPKGVEFLHEHESPLHVLKELQQALQLNREAIPQWLAEMKQSLVAMQAKVEAQAKGWMHQLEALSSRVDEGLKRLEKAVPVLPDELLARFPWTLDALSYLDRRGSTDLEAENCPLPELFSAMKEAYPELSLNEFHDGLRRLHVQRAIRLVCLEDGEGLPQPEYALFDGSRIFYLVTRET